MSLSLSLRGSRLWYSRSSLFASPVSLVHKCHNANIPTHMRWLKCPQNSFIACSLFAWLRSALHAWAAATAQSSRTSNITDQETTAAITAQAHQLTQWEGDLRQRFCRTATATATATAAAEVSHRKGSQDREVGRQRISQLERRHPSCSRNQTSQYRFSVEMVRDNAIDAAATTNANVWRGSGQRNLACVSPGAHRWRTAVHRQGSGGNGRGA